MNRLFGTRFDVSAERCTDGIWMSLSKVVHEGKHKTFVVLDCESLLSTRRNYMEEEKLCLVLTAVSDYFILNTDISFDRNIPWLFDRML